MLNTFCQFAWWWFNVILSSAGRMSSFFHAFDFKYLHTKSDKPYSMQKDYHINFSAVQIFFLLDLQFLDQHEDITRNKLWWTLFNSLAPGRFERNLRKVIFKLILMIGGWGIFCKIALRWMSMDLTDDKSTLVQVMAWCCENFVVWIKFQWFWYLWVQ